VPPVKYASLVEKIAGTQLVPSLSHTSLVSHLISSGKYAPPVL
jgi:hypothetical protein